MKKQVRSKKKSVQALSRSLKDRVTSEITRLNAEIKTLRSALIERGRQNLVLQKEQDRLMEKLNQPSYIKKLDRQVESFISNHPPVREIKHSEGDMFFASSFLVDTKIDRFMLLNQLDNLLHRFSKERCRPLCLIVSDRDILRLFGNSLRNLNYGGIPVAACRGVTDGHIIFVTKHFAP